VHAFRADLLFDSAFLRDPSGRTRHCEFRTWNTERPIPVLAGGGCHPNRQQWREMRLVLARASPRFHAIITAMRHASRNTARRTNTTATTSLGPALRKRSSEAQFVTVGVAQMKTLLAPPSTRSRQRAPAGLWALSGGPLLRASMFCRNASERGGPHAEPRQPGGCEA